MKKALSGITLNGEPLADVIDRANGREMHETLTDAAPHVPGRRRASKHTGNLSRERSSAAQVVYRRDQEWQKVRAYGAVFRWDEKASMGWVYSGYSIFGVVELNETEDKARCHHCGESFTDVSKHLVRSGINPKDHRIMHGFTRRESLNSTSSINTKSAVTKRRIANGSLNIAAMLAPEVRLRAITNAISAKKIMIAKRVAIIGRGAISPGRDNNKDRCRAQTITHLKTLAQKLERTPRTEELRSYIHKECHVLEPARLRELFGSVRNAMLLAGLVPRQRFGRLPQAIAKAESRMQAS